MTERTGFIEVADANNIIFTGSKVEDFLIYTETSNQSILIGTLRSNMATIEMRSNIVTINGKLGINTSNPSVAFEFNTTDAIQIPKGTTEQRPDPTALGQIRYNTSINTFEGFGAGNAWGSLGGVKDTNQDTFVSAESHPTSNDDIIRFYNSNNETMRITKIGRIGISNQSPSERLELNGGNAKFNSNVYILERLGIANSNPTEALEVTGNAKITSNLEIGGNLTVLGSTTTVDATTVNIADNIIRLNNGASFISSLQAGIEVNRGTSLSNYYIIYDEQSKYTKIGEDNKLQIVATRDDDTPINTIAFYDSNNRKYTACNDFVYVDGNLGLGTSNPDTRMEIIGTDAILIPRGTTAQRPPTTKQGQIRYNTSINTFEGYGAGNAWGTLGGVKDINQDTFISAEAYPTSNDDILRFFNSNNETMRIMIDGRIGISNQAPSERLELNGGNAKFNSNIYVLQRQSIGKSNPTEALDIIGNLKASSNIYSINRIGIANSNPTEALDITGNLKASSNLYVLRRQAIGTSNPTEALDITGNLKASSNIYSMSRVGIANSNPTEALDITGNLKASSNIYSINRIGIANSNPTEALDITGNLKASSNIYSINRIGVANSNPTEALDITGNLKASSNIYSINRIGVANSNPTEALDITGNLKASSNIYSMSRIGVANSNPTEALDITGNLKASSNIYSMSRVGIANSNPTEALDITGNLKASSNIYSMSRIGVRTSNPAYTLEVIGDISSSNIYLSGSGTATNPSLTWISSSNTGIYLQGQNMNFVSSSSNVLSLSNYKVGILSSQPTESLDIKGNTKVGSNLYVMSNIGIGKSNPQVSLDINGTDAVLIPKGTTGQRPSNPEQGYIRYNTQINTFEGFGAGYAWGSLGGVKDTNQDTYISAESFPTSNDDILRFINSNNETLRIMPSGRVGISNQNPSEMLEVNGNIKISSNIYAGSSISIGKSNISNSNNLDVIGNTAIDGNITSTKYITSRGLQIRNRNGPFFSQGIPSAGTVTGLSNDDSGLILSISEGTSSNYFKFIATSNEILKLTGDGNLINNGWYINTSNYGLCNTTLNTYISPNTSNFGNWMIQGNALGNWNGLRFVQPEISLLCGSNELRQFGVHYNGDGWGLLLDENKNLYIAGDVTSYWSDKRLKENFQEIEDSHDIIQQLTGFRFNWNEKGQRILNKTAEETEVGLIAQDVQRVIPQAVKVNKSSLSLNNENGDENNEYLTINYDKIIPFLIQGYKRHTKEIEELKTIIKELLPKQ